MVSSLRKWGVFCWGQLREKSHPYLLVPGRCSRAVWVQWGGDTGALVVPGVLGGDGDVDHVTVGRDERGS